MARPTKREQTNKKISQAVSKMTPENLQKLKEAFAIGATVIQACDYADLAERTYYYWIEKNPELLQEFDRYREKLPFKAKYNIAQQIHAGNVALSQWLLSRKEPEAYGETVKLEHSGAIAQDEGVHPEDEELRKEFKKRLMDNIKQRALAKENTPKHE